LAGGAQARDSLVKQAGRGARIGANRNGRNSGL